MALRRAERGLPFVGLPSRRDAAGFLLFVAVLSVDVYLIENTDRVNSDRWLWLGMTLLLIGYFGGGLVIGKWWASALLPILAVLIAFPAGENPAYGGDIPWVAFIYVFLIPLWMALVAIGVLIHKVAARFGPKRRRREPRLA
jgi:cytochrome c biogenesis protein CcdA